MKRYAMYRALYGEDFIQESIESIDPFVDKIFVFWDNRPWGGNFATGNQNNEGPIGVNFKDHWISFPDKFDNLVEKVKALNNPKIELIYHHNTTDGHNIFTEYMNQHILPNWDRPTSMMMVEPDHIHRPENLNTILDQMDAAKAIVATHNIIELWKHPKYRILRSRQRHGTVIWNMKPVTEVFPPTGLSFGDSTEKFPMHYVEAKSHNFGFCVSPKNMLWKTLISLAISGKGHRGPDPNWFKEKWLDWDFKTNNFDLEPTFERGKNIKKAIDYDVDSLPESIKNRIRNDKPIHRDISLPNWFKKIYDKQTRN